MSKELRSAEFMWAEMSGLNQADKNLLALHREMDFPQSPQMGWLRNHREALLFSQAEMASRIGMTKQGYAKLESNEVRGSASLANMQIAAEAMGCEFVYFIRPKNKRTLSSLLWEKILPQVLKIYKFRFRSKAIKPMVLANIAYKLLKDPVFGREMKWSRNRHIQAYR
jgi:predicted DNA-binding mobile mystery protein A